jgi:hypothetical protein
VADSGWLMMNDGTIGSATSGATYANVLAEALFTLLFTNILDVHAPILTSAGAATTRAAQTNAATAWANNCRMSLTKQLGRSLAIAGAGSGLTSRPLGSMAGAETETPTVAKTATHLHGSVSHGVTSFSASSSGAIAGLNHWGYDGSYDSLGTSLSDNEGAGNSLNILDPSAYWNVMIKL